MALLNTLKRALGIAAVPQKTAPTPSQAQPAEIRVPEVTAVELLAERKNSAAPTLLDCREHSERRQGAIPDSLHIPMNQIPHRLAELDRSANLVVFCAHGNRSYGVTAWLIEQGFSARSLRGGIVDWQLRGGEISRP